MLEEKTGALPCALRGLPDLVKALDYLDRLIEEEDIE